MDPLLLRTAGSVLAIVIFVALVGSGIAQTVKRPAFGWAGATALCIAYWLTAVLGLRWAAVSDAGSPVGPAAGVGLAGLLLGGVRLWPAILIGRLAAAITSGSDQPGWAEVTAALDVEAVAA